MSSALAAAIAAAGRRVVSHSMQARWLHTSSVTTRTGASSGAHGKTHATSGTSKGSKAANKAPTGGWQPASCYDVTLPEPFPLVLGGSLANVTVHVEEYGAHTLPAERTVVVMPSFSHSAHVASNGDDPSPGWWEDLVGSGKAVDTRHWRVVCISLLGSPHSPTNPTARNPATGRPFAGAFPQVTPADLARCHAAVLDVMGVTGQLRAVVGASLGGMQALQFASLFPDRTARCVAVAATGRTTPFTVGIRRMQRRAILGDPAYHGGNYAEHGTSPAAGLRLARELGTLFYRSREEFDARFSWEPGSERHFSAQDTWEVESYLNYQGAKFVRSADANAYLLLSKAMDLHNLGDGVAGRATYAEGAARIRANTLLIGVRQDALIPAAELAMLAECMTAHGGTATFLPWDNVLGHDAFLKDPAGGWLAGHLRAHLEGGLEAHLAAELVHNTASNAP